MGEKKSANWVVDEMEKCVRFFFFTGATQPNLLIGANAYMHAHIAELEMACYMSDGEMIKELTRAFCFVVLDLCAGDGDGDGD